MLLLVLVGVRVMGVGRSIKALGLAFLLSIKRSIRFIFGLVAGYIFQKF